MALKRQESGILRWEEKRMRCVSHFRLLCTPGIRIAINTGQNFVLLNFSWWSKRSRFENEKQDRVTSEVR